ncbi:PTS sugar transporter subunit IIB [Neobacillus notoginsengisoli]|nr:PTS sugar transporter subunit IIB [Neobacillus notoginsengisoli]
MKTVLVVCSSGLGTSLMIRIYVEAICKEVGIKANVIQTDASSMNYYTADLIIGARQIIESLPNYGGIETVSLDKITDRKQIKDRILDSSLFQHLKEG